MNVIASTDGGRELRSQWCAIVDSREQRVVHIHQYIAADESGMLSPEELARQAIEQASPHSERESLTVVHPEPDTPFGPDMRYSVGSEGRLEARPFERPQRRRPPTSSSS